MNARRANLSPDYIVSITPVSSLHPHPPRITNLSPGGSELHTPTNTQTVTSSKFQHLSQSSGKPCVCALTFALSLCSAPTFLLPQSAPAQRCLNHHHRPCRFQRGNWQLFPPSCRRRGRPPAQPGAGIPRPPDELAPLPPQV